MADFPFPIDDGTPTKRTPEEKMPKTPERFKWETERTMQKAIELEKLTEDTKRRMEVIVRDAKEYPGYIPRGQEDYAVSWLENYDRIRPPMPFSNKERVFGRPYSKQNRGGGSYPSKPIATPLTYATAKKVDKTQDMQAMAFLAHHAVATPMGNYYPTAVATPKKSKKSKKGGKKKGGTKKRANRNKN